MHHQHYYSTATIHVKLTCLEESVEDSFTAYMPLLTVISRLERTNYHTVTYNIHLLLLVIAAFNCNLLNS